MEKERKTNINASTESRSEPKEDRASEPEANLKSQEPTSASKGDLPDDLEGAYRKLLAERNDLYNRLLRGQAELENFRKRLQREKEDFLQHAAADLIRALLPVLDSFERALGHRDGNVPEDFYRGIELIYANMREILARAGLAPIDTAGKIFDPHVHQAVETVKAPGHRDQEIVEELQRGYKLKHRLLRPAIVKVAIASQSASAEGNGEVNAGQDKPADPA